MKKLIAILVLALGLVFGPLLGTIAPAQASDCPADYTCTTETGGMGTTYTQVYVGPAPTPVAYEENWTAPAPAPCETEQTVTQYRAQVALLKVKVARLQSVAERRAATIQRLRAVIRALR